MDRVTSRQVIEGILKNTSREYMQEENINATNAVRSTVRKEPSQNTSSQSMKGYNMNVTITVLRFQRERLTSKY